MLATKDFYQVRPPGKKSVSPIGARDPSSHQSREPGEYVTTPRDKLDKRLGYSESLEAVTDVRKKMKKSGESPRSAQRHQLMHNGAIDGRKASDRTFKVPKQYNHKSTGRLVHRYPANTVRNTVDILNLPDFHNDQKFADYHSPS